MAYCKAPDGPVAGAHLFTVWPTVQFRMDPSPVPIYKIAPLLPCVQPTAQLRVDPPTTHIYSMAYCKATGGPVPGAYLQYGLL